jgi:pimeloyl-ACP methyl ester carboxylesterase
MPRPLSVPFLTLALTGAVAGADVQWHTLETPDGPVTYALVVPEDAGDRPRPALLALPPGPQDRRMVEAGLQRYWGRQAAARGWIVVSPAAPDGKLFFQGAERAIPALLDHVAGRLAIEGGVFHLAGSSNGGRSAFRVAGLHPERFASLTVLPGYPPADEDVARLPGLKGLPVRMFVGGNDGRWKQAMERTLERLETLGVDARLTVLPGEGHVPPSLDGPVMMNHLESLRSATAGVAEPGPIGAVLDALHESAAGADGQRYFSLFTDDAVFLGTDATERWTLPEFRGFAEPLFARGTGWTYRATERHVTMGPDGRTAWFDELLHNEKYGQCRGTGVLVRDGDRWRIAQYHLTIPVPNEIALDVVDMIRRLEP